VDHVTVWRWSQRYAPELGRRCAGTSARRTTRVAGGRDLRADERKMDVLVRAVDSCGATIDFLLSAKRDSATAQRFLTKAVGGENYPEPRARSGRQL
jgi:transposase, IS6 family